MPAFTFEYAVPYGSIDFARIVYYPQFLHFCHLTMEAMFPAVVGVSYASVIQDEQVGYPTVRADAEFVKPVAYGETLRLSMITEGIGRASVRVRYEGRRTSDDALAFRVHNVHVAVDIPRWKSVPVPARHRAAFESLREIA